MIFSKFDARNSARSLLASMSSVFIYVSEFSINCASENPIFPPPIITAFLPAILDGRIQITHLSNYQFPQLEKLYLFFQF